MVLNEAVLPFFFCFWCSMTLQSKSYTFVERDNVFRGPEKHVNAFTWCG